MCNTIKKYIYIILKNSSHNYHHPQNYLTQIIGYKKQKQKKSNILLPSNHYYNAVTQSLPIRPLSKRSATSCPAMLSLPPLLQPSDSQDGGDVTPLEKIGFLLYNFQGEGGETEKKTKIYKSMPMKQRLTSCGLFGTCIILYIESTVLLICQGLLQLQVIQPFPQVLTLQLLLLLPLTFCFIGARELIKEFPIHFH